MTNFKAKANVNFNIDISKYAEVQSYVKDLIETLRSPENPYPMPPLNTRVVSIFRGAILEFGDKLVYEDGSVKVYPKEIFDRFSKEMIALPNQGFGDVASNHDKLLSQLGGEERALLAKVKTKNLERYDMQPFLEKVS